MKKLSSEVVTNPSHIKLKTIINSFVIQINYKYILIGRNIKIHTKAVREDSRHFNTSVALSIKISVRILKLMQIMSDKFYKQDTPINNVVQSSIKCFCPQFVIQSISDHVLQSCVLCTFFFFLFCYFGSGKPLKALVFKRRDQDEVCYYIHFLLSALRVQCPRQFSSHNPIPKPAIFILSQNQIKILTTLVLRIRKN